MWRVFCILFVIMIKTIYVILQFASILTLLVFLNAPLLFAAEREYVVPMEKSQWQIESRKQRECSLSQTIPFYGEAKFTHKSGYKIKFMLHSDELVMQDNVKIILQSEPPSWRHDDQVFNIGQFTFIRGHDALKVKSPYASRMLQQIENGMSPVIIYRDMADGRDIVSIMLSPINFRQALTQYRECERTLVDFDLDRIKNLALYFATNKDVLTASSKRDLNNVKRYLTLDPSILQIKVDAHADARGRRRFNDNLSERRSKAIVNYLYSIGIKKEMVYAVSHGERDPKYTNKTAVGRSKNRRADVQLLSVAPPTFAERQAMADARKMLRRRQLSERSIFNQPVSVTGAKKSKKKAPEKLRTIKPVSAHTASEPVNNEPPAPNFINLDNLVDKNNQKIKSK